MASVWGNYTVLRRFRTIFLLLAAVFAMTPPGVRADDSQLSAQRVALLLLKTVSYDTNLKGRSGASVGVAVVSRETGKNDKFCGEVFNALVEQAKTTTVAGLPVKVSEVEFKDGPSTDSHLKELKARVAYLCPSALGVVDQISQVTRRNSIISVAGDRLAVERGISVGLIARETKPVILVNVGASKAEGSEFGVELLRLAEIVK